MAEFKVGDKVNFISAVGGGKVTKNSTNSKCPNCEKDIAVSELQQVYTQATSSRLAELARYLNKYKKKYNLNTCARKAHFFAQSIQESGSDLEPGIRGEGFNYYKDNLGINLGAFRSTEGRAIAQRYGRQQLRGTPITEANQIILANYAYGPQYTTGANFRNRNNDGWNFRGRGLLQITGRSNYQAIQNTINTLSPESNVNILRKYDNPNRAISVANGYMTVEEAVLTGLADWYKEKMYVQADKTGTMDDDDVVNLIIDIINKYTDSKPERKAHYQKTKLIFTVDSCPQVKPKNQPIITNNNIKWHNPVDNPRLTKYNFGGAIKPSSATYGECRRKQTARGLIKKYHGGVDFFAIPGVDKVYACLMIGALDVDC